MRKIESTTKPGTIIQIRSTAPFIGPKYTVVQTYGRPLEHSILCADRLKIKTVLLSDLRRDVVIISPSTVHVDDEFVGWMRFFTYTGQNVYVYSFHTKKQWYVDAVV